MLVVVPTTCGFASRRSSHVAVIIFGTGISFIIVVVVVAAAAVAMM